MSHMGASINGPARSGLVLALLALLWPGVVDLTRSSTLNSSANPPVQQMLADRLRTHVDKLAGEIGERNVFRPRALHAAADYIRAEWADQGYQVAAHSYQVEGVLSENLEVTLPGK